MGLIACFMLPMVCHLPVVMQSPVDWVMHPESMLEIITEHRCTLAWMPNFAFQFIPRRTPGRPTKELRSESFACADQLFRACQGNQYAGVRKRIRTLWS